MTLKRYKSTKIKARALNIVYNKVLKYMLSNKYRCTYRMYIILNAKITVYTCQYTYYDSSKLKKMEKKKENVVYVIINLIQTVITLL